MPLKNYEVYHSRISSFCHNIIHPYVRSSIHPSIQPYNPYNSRNPYNPYNPSSQHPFLQHSSLPPSLHPTLIHLSILPPTQLNPILFPLGQIPLLPPPCFRLEIIRRSSFPQYPPPWGEDGSSLTIGLSCLQADTIDRQLTTEWTVQSEDTAAQRSRTRSMSSDHVVQSCLLLQRKSLVMYVPRSSACPFHCLRPPLCVCVRI